MNDNIKKRQSCAVYCRVSSDERLDQSFNSIDAQKEAGHAYVASQRSEGWIPVADDYDDPGFTGGNTERPGLKRLMADIENGLIDIVVVYKIDRLTRNLADFSKMVEVFERKKVSFVSVTQQFNTTTSMGRLMLNVLLSFAQFEREVTGERIRDKIAASKRKGMWMGGVPPLGYDVRDHTLVPNAQEAELVRYIFQRFVETGSATSLVKELRLSGFTSKSWITQDGKLHKGKFINKGSLYRILNNRAYIGEIGHKGEWHKGKHKPLIKHELWDAAHAVIGQPVCERIHTKRAQVQFLLKGVVKGPEGRAMSTSWTRKADGRMYRYYIHSQDAKEFAGASGLPRLPAAELEATVVSQLRELLRSPQLRQHVAQLAATSNEALDEAQVWVGMQQIDRIWDELFPTEQERIIKLLVERVTVYEDEIDVKLRSGGVDLLAHDLHQTANAPMTAEQIA